MAAPVRPGSGVQDVVGDRDRFLRVGMLAVFSACALFAVARLAVTLRTGLATPWWVNAAGAATIAGLYAWHRARPSDRSTAAAHGTALVATVALLVPVAYGMESTIWWLSLVGLAMLLLGRGREALAWGVAVPLLAVAATLAEPYVQVRGSAGEPPLERGLARAVFGAIVVGIAYGFRRVATDRAVALARANAARSRFLAHVSHEIRTPLHGVLSMTELALKAELPAEARHQVETAHQSARVLLGLLNNVLDLTRAESDALVLEAKPFDLHEALGEVLRPLAAQARGQGLAFSATAAPGLPRSRRGDRYRVAQIALNLVGNALKFTRQGSISVRLSGTPAGPDRVLLAVEDTGSGIEPELARVVFEPFSQGTAARASGGAGLGLAIVQELAKKMGGRATVESEPGRGSRFIVSLELPLEAGAEAGPEDLLAAAPAPTNVPAPAATAGEAPPASMRILVCEDEPTNQKVVGAMLRRLGHKPSLVATAEEAWSALLEEPFDLLLTDVELPGMDGLELTRRVRERERERSLPRLPIVAGTAHVGQGEKDRLLEAGVDAHLAKPFSIADLQAVVRATATAAESRSRSQARAGSPSRPLCQ